MSMDTVIDLGKACGRELSEAEAARLLEAGSRLNLREDDALWPLLAAMEYQRIYYEALPEKIAEASRAIMEGMAAAAEKKNYERYEKKLYGLECIACGSCTYICPAKRPLMQLFKQAKAEIMAAKRK